MSRPRSRSPRYRRFPWEEPNFDPHKVVAGLDGEEMDRSFRPREGHEEHLDYLRENKYPDSDRRSPPFPDDRQFMRQRHPNQEEFYCKQSSQHDMRGYDDRRLSPLRDGGGNGDRRRGGLRDPSKSSESRRRLPHSPLRLARERLPPAPRSYSDHQERELEGWRRDEQTRGRGRFRDFSPSVRLNDQRGDAYRERERRNTQGPNRDRQREELHHEWTPPFKSQRREIDDSSHHLGYKNEEDFGKQRYSMDTPRDGTGGDFQESRVDSQHSGPLVIEHDHGIAHGSGLSRWKQFGDRRDLDPDFNQQRRSPRRLGSPQELCRGSESRLADRDNARGRHFQDDWRDSNYHERRRSPAPKDRPNPTRYGKQDGPMIHRGRSVPHTRGRISRGQGGRTGPHRNPPRLLDFSRGYQDLPLEEQRSGNQPPREKCYEGPDEMEPDLAEESRQQWKRDRPGSVDQDLRKIDLDPKMPRQKVHGWNTQKNTTASAEETLTIKVDMNQPVNQNSSLCYSSDRQLSFDLVNVGRQRLDFLPMLEHSGTYRETAMHTGTFAQEIITLLHHVKEQHFKGDGLTLNERFTAPQKSSYTAEDMEEMTLDERFRSNRGFNLNTSFPLDDDEPLFVRMGSLQPVRGPGDLRHDLERRRQERLEGVKVTISGNTMSHCPLSPVSEPSLEYTDKDEMALMDDEEFSNWPEEQSRRRQTNMGPRRGASFRLNTSSQRRNSRFGGRLGPVRRQNNRNNSAGPNW